MKLLMIIVKITFYMLVYYKSNFKATKIIEKIITTINYYFENIEPK